MAITSVALDDFGSVVSSSATSAPIAPGANRLLLAVVENSIDAGLPNTPTVTGNGLTWVQIATVPHNGRPGGNRFSVFRAMGAAPIPGVVTVDCAGQTQHQISCCISEHDGVATTGANGEDAVVQVVTGANTTNPTLTLAALQSVESVAFGGLGYEGGFATPGAGFTQIGNQATGSNAATEVQTNVTTVNWTISFSVDDTGFAALELAVFAPPPTPAPIPGYLTGGGLGCGENQAFLADRNGRLLVKLPFSELSYGRRLDDLSEASVSLGVGGRTGEVCCDVLSRLRPWEHLLIVYRDTGEVWVGIVAEPHYTPTEVKLSARDLFQVFERRVLPFDRDFYYEDLSDIFRQYALDALSRDNSYGITVSASDSGQVGSRSVRTIEYRRAADELRELAKIGVDFTMRGRQLIATGEQTVPSFKLITSDFVNQEIGIGGLQTATEVIVKGAQAEDGSQPIGVAGGVDPTLGLVQLVIEEDSITDQASAQFAAEAYLALLQEPPTVVSGILDGRASVEFSDLVPGRVCDLRVESGCRRVIADMRLSEVSVSVSVGDEGTTESVGVTFVPVTLGQEE